MAVNTRWCKKGPNSGHVTHRNLAIRSLSVRYVVTLVGQTVTSWHYLEHLPQVGYYLEQRSAILSQQFQ